MKQEETKTNLVPALERGTRILDLIARTKGYPSLSEIAREIGIAKSSAHTLCNTLVQLELLIRRPDQTFQLGPHVMRWSNAFTQQSDVAAEFAALWDQETEMPGATITLSVLEGTEVVYIAARNSAVSHSLIEFRAGMRLPAPFTATGKAFLSQMSDFEVRRLLSDGLPEPRTPHSVQTLDALLSELQTIRKHGYSCDDQQVAEGLVCYGASVLDSRNRPIAGIAVSLQAEQLSESEKNQIISNVQRMAARLSVRMGADLN
ncbi:IclR family transcriptional regulator [Hoeflea sp. G2-23]|uniref:IclR family transcriptional regulator n=1 Tax=Hoeflea algicola TaxID=2983763 RepID=A0ABT3Z9Z5_9HYPH|nr:IclR family transcriptional regulator [Hoeflea algicola]MCY0148600.1 IclR family transcriptional regulator [Hoeflea algicola]